MIDFLFAPELQIAVRIRHAGLQNSVIAKSAELSM
jgi:hypothetical protein